MSMESDAAELVKAAAQYRDNEAKGAPWPASSDADKYAVPHYLIREPQTRQAANEQAHGCISILQSE